MPRECNGSRNRPGLLDEKIVQPDGFGAEFAALPRLLSPPGGSLKRKARGHVAPSAPFMGCIVYPYRGESQAQK